MTIKKGTQVNTDILDDDDKVIWEIEEKLQSENAENNGIEFYINRATDGDDSDSDVSEVEIMYTVISLADALDR